MGRRPQPTHGWSRGLSQREPIRPTESQAAMPDRVDTKRHTLRSLERHAEAFELARKQRDRMIVGAREEGASLRAIAAAAGVTHQTVANILERETERRARGDAPE